MVTRRGLRGVSGGGQLLAVTRSCRQPVSAAHLSAAPSHSSTYTCKYAQHQASDLDHRSQTVILSVLNENVVPLSLKRGFQRICRYLIKTEREKHSLYFCVHSFYIQSLLHAFDSVWPILYGESKKRHTGDDRF